MPDKILTDQPQAKRKMVQILIGDTYSAVAEAPYFSVPLTDEDVATLDPDDSDRELRAGELFFATGIQIANVSESPATVDVEISIEGGGGTSIAPGLTIPAKEVMTLSPGLSLFKRNLANPAAAGQIMQVKASITGTLQLTALVIEREALDHAPDTE